MQNFIRSYRAPFRFGLVALTFALFSLGGIRADEQCKVPPITEKSDSYQSGSSTIRVLRLEPSGGEKRPAVIILHGSDGWEDISRYRFPAAGINANGQIVILIRYYDRTKTPDQITPEQRAKFVRWLKGDAVNEKNNEARQHFEEWIEAVRDAVAYARKLPNVDGDRIAIAGFSLGGYLALAAAPKCDPPVAAVVGMFGGLPEEMRKNLGKMPPTHLVHGELDEVVSVNETYKAAGIILAQKQLVEIHIHKGLGHVLVDPATGKPNPWAMLTARGNMTAFLKKQLEPTTIAMRNEK